MKRLLSILLALSIVISIIPAVFAGDTPLTQTYSFASWDDIGTGSFFKGKETDGFELYRTIEEIPYYAKIACLNYTTDRNWKLHDVSDDFLKATQTAKNSAYFGLNGTYLNVLSGTNYIDAVADFSLSLREEKTGFYYPSIAIQSPETKNIGIALTLKDSTSDSAEDFVSVTKVNTTKTKETYYSDKALYTEESKELIAKFRTSLSRRVGYYDITLTEVQDAELQITAENTDAEGKIAFTTENAGETVAITSTKVDGANIDPMDVAGGFVKYVSDNDEVAAVDEKTGVITVGNAEGTAHIIAQSPDGVEKSNEITVTVTAPAEPEVPGEEVTDTKVSVAVLSENTDEGTVSWSGATIDEVNMGDTVTATATAKEGYVFKFWKNAIGQVLSEKAEESFVINTNSAITAVFDKVDDTAETVSVELYNANGMPFYTNDKVSKETTFANAITDAGTPTYTGFGSFKHWSMYADESKIADDMLIKENTRAVAIFNAPTNKYTVKVNGTAKYNDVLYGTEVTVSSTDSDFSYWKLGEKIVSYDKDYSFTVWGDADLTEVKEGSVTAAPVAVLDEVDGNPLLIYSVPKDYTIVEAGILFGSTADITISSVDGGRAAAARGTGQFTAQPKADTTPAYSRGYLIFKNASGEIRILYAD